MENPLSFVAETADPATAIAQARQLRPDLVLIDIPIGGLETAQGIRRQSSETRIVFLTGAVIGPDQATSRLAHAYIFRDSPPAAIATGIANLIRATRPVTMIWLRPTRPARSRCRSICPYATPWQPDESNLVRNVSQTGWGRPR